MRSFVWSSYKPISILGDDVAVEIAKIEYLRSQAQQ